MKNLKAATGILETTCGTVFPPSSSTAHTRTSDSAQEHAGPGGRAACHVGLGRIPQLAHTPASDRTSAPTCWGGGGSAPLQRLGWVWLRRYAMAPLRDRDKGEEKAKMAVFVCGPPEGPSRAFPPERGDAHTLQGGAEETLAAT